ncbi:hypothetical protein GCM10011591_26680 [Nocardia camponoti]|uniref:Uncharacterized protein n=1 Tax=Nocardia camponoti TaxID=1616106 RepID=A0A917QIZ5_9NOCA|nr:hypothetical protein GCM10011591_26680 [Nocardia camponoti]
MLVEMIPVRRMAVTIVDVINVVIVRHRDMPAARTVLVVVGGVLHVRGDLTFVEVVAVFAVQVTVVDVINMVAVRNRDMPTTRAVRMGVFGVFSVCRCHSYLRSNRDEAQAPRTLRGSPVPITPGQGSDAGAESAHHRKVRQAFLFRQLVPGP